MKVIQIDVLLTNASTNEVEIDTIYGIWYLEQFWERLQIITIIFLTRVT